MLGSMDGIIEAFNIKHHLSTAKGGQWVLSFFSCKGESWRYNVGNGKETKPTISACCTLPY